MCLLWGPAASSRYKIQDSTSQLYLVTHVVKTGKFDSLRQNWLFSCIKYRLTTSQKSLQNYYNLPLTRDGRIEQKHRLEGSIEMVQTYLTRSSDRELVIIQMPRKWRCFRSPSCQDKTRKQEKTQIILCKLVCGFQLWTQFAFTNCPNVNKASIMNLSLERALSDVMNLKTSCFIFQRLPILPNQIFLDNFFYLINCTLWSLQNIIYHI